MPDPQEMHHQICEAKNKTKDTFPNTSSTKERGAEIHFENLFNEVQQLLERRGQIWNKDSKEKDMLDYQIKHALKYLDKQLNMGIKFDELQAFDIHHQNGNIIIGYSEHPAKHVTITLKKDGSFEKHETTH